jgi:hypothetical protein
MNEKYIKYHDLEMRRYRLRYGHIFSSPPALPLHTLLITIHHNHHKYRKPIKTEGVFRNGFYSLPKKKQRRSMPYRRRKTDHQISMSGPISDQLQDAVSDTKDFHKKTLLVFIKSQTI